MSLTVSLRTVAAMKLAAVRRQVAIGGVGVAWRPALDKVWDFLRTKPGLRTDGHNVFLYHLPARRDMPMDVDGGVVERRHNHNRGKGDGRTFGKAAKLGDCARARQARVNYWGCENTWN